MSKLKSFVRLDFMTIKPYFTIKNLLIFAAVAVFLSIVSDNVNMSLGIGAMLGTIFVGYPFAIGEKANMDALYATLNVSRKTAVLGRYVFTLLLNVSAVGFSFVCALFGVFGARLVNGFLIPAESNPLSLILLLVALMVVIQIIQLPVFFKVGYTKAKFLNIVPFAALMAGFAAFNSIARDPSARFDNIRVFFAGVSSSGIAVPLAIAAFAAMIYASYNLSVAFYGKREF
jgi:hypothetical protein